jgi:tetratricopeptide (TPR) repeat protein
VALYILGNARDRAAQPLISLSNLYYYQGDSLRAMELAEAALELIDIRKDLRLFVFTQLNIGFFLSDVGMHVESVRVLRENRELFDQFPDPYVQLRITWLESRIAAASGDLKRAEDGFLSLREEFVLRQEGYDAAMVSLDLALIHQQQDRTGELMRLAEEMHALFASEEVHREALAALLMFEEAARKEQVTAEKIRRLAGLLKRLQG